jgi:TolB protein
MLDSASNSRPRWSPDGQLIVFESDRGGTGQLFLMAADGRNVRQVTFSSGGNAMPEWALR